MAQSDDIYNYFFYLWSINCFLDENAFQVFSVCTYLCRYLYMYQKTITELMQHYNYIQSKQSEVLYDSRVTVYVRAQLSAW